MKNTFIDAVYFWQDIAKSELMLKPQAELDVLDRLRKSVHKALHRMSPDFVRIQCGVSPNPRLHSNRVWVKGQAFRKGN